MTTIRPAADCDLDKIPEIFFILPTQITEQQWRTDLSKSKLEAE